MDPATALAAVKATDEGLGVIARLVGALCARPGAEHGYSRLAVFGSVARHEARKDSDIDLLVEAPDGTSSFDFVRFKQLVEQALEREVDLVFYGGLKANIDDDIRREALVL